MPQYGLAEGIVDAFEGYQKGETERVDRQDELKARKMKFEQGQRQLNQEGFKESIQRLMMGDSEGAMREWNARGEQRMTDLSMDDNNIVSWTEENGESHKMPLNALASMAGVDLPKPTKAAEPWAAGPADSGVLYHKGTGETKPIPGGTGKSGHKGTGMKPAQFEKAMSTRRKEMKTNINTQLGADLEQGKWAIKDDAKNLQSSFLALSETVDKNNPFAYSPSQITEAIKRRATPFLKTSDEWRQMAVTEAEKRKEIFGFKWNEKQNQGLSQDKWIEKRTNDLVDQAGKGLKTMMKDEAGLAIYLQGGGAIPSGMAEDEATFEPAAAPAKGAPGGIPTEPPAGGAPVGAIPEQGQPAAPAQPMPTGHDPEMYKALGGGQIPVGTQVGQFPSGEPILEGQRVRNQKTGESFLIVNKALVAIGPR